MITWIYSFPFHTTLTLLALLYIFWHEFPKTNIGKQIQRHKKIEKVLCGTMLLTWFIMMCYITLFSREEGNSGVALIPFHQLRQVLNGGTREILRSSWMNILLFVPGGLLLSVFQPIRWPLWVKITFTIMVLTTVSMGIEYLQWCFQLGYAEIDDVLCNSCGACLGLFISKDHSVYL